MATPTPHFSPSGFPYAPFATPARCYDLQAARTLGHVGEVGEGPLRVIDLDNATANEHDLHTYNTHGETRHRLGRGGGGGAEVGALRRRSAFPTAPVDSSLPCPGIMDG